MGCAAFPMGDGPVLVPAAGVRRSALVFHLGRRAVCRDAFRPARRAAGRDDGITGWRRIADRNPLEWRRRSLVAAARGQSVMGSRGWRLPPRIRPVFGQPKEGAGAVQRDLDRRSSPGRPVCLDVPHVRKEMGRQDPSSEGNRRWLRAMVYLWRAEGPDRGRGHRPRRHGRQTQGPDAVGGGAGDRLRSSRAAQSDGTGRRRRPHALRQRGRRGRRDVQQQRVR